MMDETITGSTNQSQNGTARPEGHPLTIDANNPKAIQKGINEICRKPHTRALAWALVVYRDAPHMEVEELYRCLDECGVRCPIDSDPYATDRRIPWLDYYESNEEKCQDDLADLRRRLKAHGIPVNE